MNKAAMYKDAIHKKAREIWFQQDDPIFGPAFDYANELTDPNMSDDDMTKQLTRLEYAEDAILNHPNLVRAIREQRLPEFIEEAKNRSLMPQTLLGGLGGAGLGTLAGKGITALSKGLGYKPIMLASQGIGALGGALGARHLAGKGMAKLVENLTKEQSGLTGTTKNMLDEVMKNVRAEDEYKRVQGHPILAQLNRQRLLDAAIERSENPIKLASYKDAIYKLAEEDSNIEFVRMLNSIGANYQVPFHPLNKFILAEALIKADKIKRDALESATEEDKNYKGNKLYKLKNNAIGAGGLGFTGAILGSLAGGSVSPKGSLIGAGLGALGGGLLGYNVMKGPSEEGATLRGMSKTKKLEPHLEEMRKLYKDVTSRTVPGTFRESGTKKFI